MATKYYSTVRAATDYERQAAEARRREALAQALEAQAYQPLSGSDAPTPAAAPLVMALQSFITARQRRKGEEAVAEAKKADVAGMQELIRELGPQERSGAESAIEQMRATAMPGQLSAQGTYTPSQITPSSEPIGMPYTQAAPTGAARRSVLAEYGIGGTPRAQELAKLLMAEKPVEYDLQQTAQGLVRVPKSGGEASLVTMGGQALMPRDAYSLGMTPQQKAQYDLDVKKFGVDIAQANLARAKAADEGVDVSGVSIPGMPTATSATATRQPVSVPQMPTRTPAQMRTEGMAGFETQPPRATGPRPAAASTSAVSAAAPPSTAPAERRKVPLIENPALGGKQKRELLMVKSQSTARAASTQSEIQNLIDMANDLKNHPGLKEITGKLGQYSVTDMSPEAREARGIYDALRYKTSLLKTAMVREANTTGGAFGNMTEQEWPRLEFAFGNISNAQDPAGLIKSLNNYIENANRMGQINLGIYEDDYGKLDWKPIGYEPLSAKYAKGKQGSSNRGGGQWGRADVVGP